ncbi:DUF2846 domain-containing protein [Ovoidimarina sediminis]|uniref:DUF2846 domain-containing protein n=1 Tax=Ovoidimarina sediminis TaxID=3079856 RepID=UPI003977D3E1
MRSAKILLLALVALIVGGCASGVSLSETTAAKAPQSSDVARIIIYRTGVFGAAVQPDVLVDGRTTSECQPNSVFFVDVPPGEHTISASSETTATIRATLPRATQLYVECSIGMGIMVGRPQLRRVEPSEAQGRIGQLVYSGSYRIN